MAEAALIGLLNGSIAALLCTLYREHRLLNLAAAAWVCLGAWLAAAITGRLLPGANERTLIVAVVFLLLLGSLQVVGVVLLRQRLIEHPTLYLFIALAVHLLLVTAGGNLIPNFRGDVIASGSEHSALFRTASILPIASSLVVIASVAFIRSHSFAIHTIQLRGGGQTKRSWRYIAAIQGIQILLLVFLGGCAKDVTKGHFAAMNIVMVTTTLTAIAARGKPLAAFFWSFGLAWLELVLRQFQNIGALATPIVLLVLVIVILVAQRPIPQLPFLPPNRWIGSLAQSDKQVAAQHFAIAIAFLLGMLVWQEVLNWSDVRLVHVVLTAAYGLLAYASIRYCGIVTAALPALGGCILYAVVHFSRSPSAWGIAILALTIAAAVSYLYLLRAVSLVLALFIDLSTIVALHQVIAGSSLLAGHDNTLEMGRSLMFNMIDATAPYFLWIVAAFILFMTTWVHASQSGRLFAHGSSDVFHALRNGLRPRVLILIASSILVFLSLVSRWIEVAATGSIAPESVNPIFGITSLFFGYVMATGTSSGAFLLAIFLVGVFPEVAHIQGEWRDAWLGSLVCFVVLREAMRHWRDSENFAHA